LELAGDTLKPGCNLQLKGKLAKFARRWKFSIICGLMGKSGKTGNWNEKNEKGM
jgi:hypothetical protein